MIKINVDQVTDITTHIKRENPWWTWQPKKVFFGFITQKEGYVTTLDFLAGDNRKPLTKEQVEEDKELYCENNKVYFKPYLDLCLSSGESYTVDFETADEMSNFIDLNFKKVKLIEIK